MPRAKPHSVVEIDRQKAAIVEFATWILHNRDIAISDIVSRLEQMQVESYLSGITDGKSDRVDFCGELETE